MVESALIKINAYKKQGGPAEEAMATAEYWEFFCSPETDSELLRMCWAWRRIRNGDIVFQSDYFDAFTACHANAVAHGFAGEIRFAA